MTCSICTFEQINKFIIVPYSEVVCTRKYLNLILVPKYMTMICLFVPTVMAFFVATVAIAMIATMLSLVYLKLRFWQPSWLGYECQFHSSGTVVLVYFRNPSTSSVQQGSTA